MRAFVLREEQRSRLIVPGARIAQVVPALIGFLIRRCRWNEPAAMRVFSWSGRALSPSPRVYCVIAESPSRAKKAAGAFPV